MSTKTKSYYSRLFTGHRPGYPHKVLTQLAEKLKDIPANRGNRKRMPGSACSGYAYLGQFINHDLSLDSTDWESAGDVEPEKTQNKKTARLDLEPLYGGESNDGSVIYDGDKLGLGRTKSDKRGRASSDNDLPRDKNGIATIPDGRNDITLLIAQLHVLLIKFHNRIVDDLSTGNIPSAGPDEGSSFAKARRLVTWHYQWIVKNDFLSTLVAPDVLQDIMMHWPRLYRPKQGKATVPVEFAWAAFQYGHSAVQSTYNINRSAARLSLVETFYMTGRGGLAKPNDPQNVQLPERYVVDAGRMFGWAPPGVSNVAEEIDTLIAKGLYEIPLGFVLFLTGTPARLAFAAKGNATLTEITLRRGAGIGIPSGQEACRLAGVDALSADQLAFGDDLTVFLRRNGLLESTPLFYYILREAEVAGRASPGGRPCKRLGPLGSRIVAEVLLGILKADEDSFMHYAWQPPLIRLKRSNQTIRVDSLKKLAFYASGRAV
ncbi:MAG TPA: peroxidase family protein [Chthoniobacterales bacterium]|nr:peroxidase family protein [Chthoniobacterales bacterium]